MSVEPALGTRIYSTRNTEDKADRQFLNDNIQVMVKMVERYISWLSSAYFLMRSVILMIVARVAPRKGSIGVGEAET